MVANKEKNFVSVVVYVHNNEQTIKYFLKQISMVFYTHFEKFEIICVNDASIDNSVQLIKEIADTLPHSVLSIINMSFFQGQEVAMNAGIDLAIGDFVFEFDTHFIDYNLQIVIETYFHSLKDFDIVSVSNKNQRFTSNLFYKIYNRNANTQYKLKTETFRILSRRAINRIRAMSKIIPYRKALYASCGLKADTLYYTAQKQTRKFYSKLHRKHRQETAINTLILFTDIAYKVSITLTLLLLFGTFAGIVYTIVTYLTKNPVAGYTATMLLLSSAFFGVFAILAIIIKYLSILVDLLFRRQKYIVESIEKIS